MIYLYIYLIVVNCISALVCIYDKICAVKKWHRVPERHLFTLCGIGGCVGTYLAIWLVRHKTLKRKFTFGIPLIFLSQCVLVLLITKLIEAY